MYAQKSLFRCRCFISKTLPKKFNDEQTALATVNAGKSRVRVHIPSKRVQGIRVDLDSCPCRVSMSNMVHISEPLKEAAEFFGRLSFLAFLHHHAVIFWLFRHSRIVSMEELTYAMLLVVTISHLQAYVSYKPAFVLARVIFGGAHNRTSA